jgi:hypothetical protein
MDAKDSTITPKQRADVERHVQRTALTRRRRDRLQLVLAAGLGDEVERSARWSGRSVEPVVGWLARGAAGGVAALAEAKRSGRPVWADATSLAAMETALETVPSALGLALAVWTSERVAADLEPQTRIHLAPGWLRVRLAEHGWGCGQPTHPLHHRQDPAAVAASRAAPRGRRWGNRSLASRSATRCTSRTRRSWRPLPTCAAPGTARQSSRRSLAPGPLGTARCVARCVAASTGWGRAAWTGCGPPRTAPGACALWSACKRSTRRCTGRSDLVLETAQPIPAAAACRRWRSGATGST